MKNQYFKSINRAIGQGAIVFSPDCQTGKIGDNYSHLLTRDVYGKAYPGGFSEFNTRGISQTCRQILEDLLKKSSKEQLKAIDLGAGAGVAALQISSLSKRLLVDAISLTPFAPDLELCVDVVCMVGYFDDYIRKSKETLSLSWVDEQLSHYHDFVKWKLDPNIEDYEVYSDNQKLNLVNIAMSRPWGITFSAAVELNGLGYNIFKQCDVFMRKQYIGDLCSSETTFDDKYDFIHDEWGAMHYSLKNASEKKSGQMILKVFDLLESDGIFYASHIRENKLKFFKKFKDIDFKIDYNDNSNKSVSIIGIKRK